MCCSFMYLLIRSVYGLASGEQVASRTSKTAGGLRAVGVFAGALARKLASICLPQELELGLLSDTVYASVLVAATPNSFPVNSKTIRKQNNTSSTSKPVLLTF